MRGGFDALAQETLRDLQNAIEELGHFLVSKHQTSPSFHVDESIYSNTQIHDRDYEFLLKAKAGVFEISNSSLGVGGEISDMIHLNKPVLCLFRRGLENSVSAYTQGKQGSKHVHTPFECGSYESIAEAKTLIKEFVNFQVEN